MANEKPRARSSARSHDFDWVNGIHVKAMQPRSCESGEDCGRRQFVTPCDEETPVIFRQFVPAIEPSSEAPPRFALQRAPGQAGPLGLGQRKRPLRQFRRDPRSSAHPIMVGGGDL